LAALMLALSTIPGGKDAVVLTGVIPQRAFDCKSDDVKIVIDFAQG
jgi:hypothetical protein